MAELYDWQKQPQAYEWGYTAEDFAIFMLAEPRAEGVDLKPSIAAILKDETIPEDTKMSHLILIDEMTNPDLPEATIAQMAFVRPDSKKFEEHYFSGKTFNRREMLKLRLGMSSLGVAVGLLVATEAVQEFEKHRTAAGVFGAVLIFWGGLACGEVFQNSQQEATQ